MELKELLGRLKYKFLIENGSIQFTAKALEE